MVLWRSKLKKLKKSMSDQRPLTLTAEKPPWGLDLRKDSFAARARRYGRGSAPARQDVVLARADGVLQSVERASETADL
jgi:hypothetical protein